MSENSILKLHADVAWVVALLWIAKVGRPASRLRTFISIWATGTGVLRIATGGKVLPREPSAFGRKPSGI